MNYTVETKNKLFQFKDYHGKLLYLLFRTTDESSIQEGGKVTITNARVFFQTEWTYFGFWYS